VFCQKAAGNPNIPPKDKT